MLNINMLRRLLMVPLILISVVIHGQYKNPKGCGQVEMTERLFQENPQLKAQYGAAHQKVMKEKSDVGRLGLKDGETVVIPVVFHIVYDNDASNISDEQVRSSIADLNASYNKEDHDSDDIVEAFRDIDVPWNFEFRIASRDPAGNCTNGILRYFDTRSSEGSDAVKEGRQWPSDKYLNIYVVRAIEDRGVAGYAYLPGVPGNIDGIVINSNRVGTIGTSTSSRASTLVHEVGHYLGLYHPWGPNNDAGESTNCNVDDEVNDTPNTTGGYFCNFSRTSCGSLDNVQNYMDYSNCNTEMFTDGQRARCVSFMNSNTGGRGDMVSAGNITATGTDYDRGQFPDNICRVDFTTDIARQEACLNTPIQFFDNSTYQIIDWQWSFPGGTPSTSSERDPTVIYSDYGEYPVTLTVTSANGETETLTRENAVAIYEHPELLYPVEENFNNGLIFDAPPFGWYSLENPDNDVSWELEQFVGFNDQVGVALRVVNVASVGRIDAMTSYGIEIPETAADVGIRLLYTYAHTYNQNNRDPDVFRVLTSTDCGNTWEILDEVTGDELKTSDVETFDSWDPDGQEDWKTRSVNLDPYKGQIINLKFEYLHNGGNNMFLDFVRTDEVVGINEGSALTNLKVYPNPAFVSDGIYLQGFEGELDHLELYNSAGVQIEELNPTYNAGNVLLKPTKLTPGLYILKVDAQTEIRAFKILVK